MYSERDILMWEKYIPALEESNLYLVIVDEIYKEPKDLYQWKSKRFSPKEALEEAKKGFIIAIPPSSGGLVCVDADVDEKITDPLERLEKGDEIQREVIQRLGIQPSFVVASKKPGNRHLYFSSNYKDINGKGEPNWKFPGIGDCRGENYVAIWNLETYLNSYFTREITAPVDVSVLRSALPSNPDKGTYIEGDRNNTLFRNVCGHLRRGDEAAIEKEKIEAKKSGLSDAEIWRTVESARKIVGEQQAGLVVVEDLNAETFAKMLEHPSIDIGARFNLDSDTYEFRENDVWMKYPNRKYNWLKTQCEKYFRKTNAKGEMTRFSWPANKFHETLDSYMVENEVSPIIQGLEKLKINENLIEMVNLDNWMQPWGVGNTPEEQWVQRYFLISLVRRLYEPGCQMRWTPVLVGPAGVGKSSLCKHLLPPNMQYLFTDNFSFDMNQQQTREAVSGHLIIEMTEMDGLNGSNASRIKSFISREVDKGRPAYGRVLEEKSRRFILVGTANDDAFSIPYDMGLIARFGVLYMSKMVDVPDYMNRVRNHLWAMARDEYFAMKERGWAVPPALPDGYAEDLASDYILYPEERNRILREEEPGIRLN